MQSGKAASIPAALAAGLITMNSSHFHNCFDYPPVSVVSPFRRDKSLLLLQLLHSCCLNISISGHVASKHDFPTPPSFPQQISDLDSRVKSRKKEERESSPRGLWKFPQSHGPPCCCTFFPSELQKREHLGTCPFPITCTRNRHYHCRDTSPSFGNEPTDPLPFPPPLPRGARSGAVSRGVIAFQRGASRGGRGDERDERLYPGTEQLTSARGTDGLLPGALRAEQGRVASPDCKPAPSCVQTFPFTNRTGVTQKGLRFKQQTQAFGAVFSEIPSATFSGVCSGYRCTIPLKIRHQN